MKRISLEIDLFVLLTIIVAIIFALMGLVSWWVALLIFLTTCHFKLDL